MIGHFLTRGLVMVFGYAYPAYECFKSVEMNKPDIEQLRFWCQYWILVAMLTVCERIGDTFVSWVPMYSEAKLAFYIYLWYPKTKGTVYVYDSFFKPYIEKHEPEIDRNLTELKTRAGNMFVLYWQRAASYGQTRILDILQYIASQSATKPHTPSSDSAPHQRDAADAEGHPQVPPAPSSSAAVLKAQRAMLSQSLAMVAKSQTSNEVEMTETEPSGNPDPPPKEVVMEEDVKVYTRVRSRKAGDTSGQ
ncbi:hypothetical protein Hdeb2414_s0006g00224121 [Helianthus debilis subsp. tardiflorus]